MLMLSGGPALTPFNLEKFAARVADRQMVLGTCSARFFYLVDSVRMLDPAEVQILEKSTLSRTQECPDPIGISGGCFSVQIPQ